MPQLAGAGYGATKGLEDIVAQRMAEQRLAAAIQDQLEQRRLAQSALNERVRGDEEDRKQRGRQLDMQEAGQKSAESKRLTDENRASDQSNVRRMLIDTITHRTGPLTEEDRRGMAGMAIEAGDNPAPYLTEPKPIVDPIAQHEAFAKIDAQYRAPTKPDKPTYQKFVVDGKEQMLTPEEVRAMGGVKVNPPQKAVTGAERMAMNFYNRGVEGHGTASALEDKIGKMGLVEQTRLQSAPNWMQSQDGQTYRQAQREFTEARLRKESGAAIPPDEYQNDARTYFAQPGDTPQTLAQKKTARETILKGLKNEAHRAIAEFETGAPDETPISDVVLSFNPTTGKLEQVKK